MSTVHANAATVPVVCDECERVFEVTDAGLAAGTRGRFWLCPEHRVPGVWRIYHRTYRAGFVDVIGTMVDARNYVHEHHDDDFDEVVGKMERVA